MARHDPLGERVARLEERLRTKLPAIEEKLGETAQSLNGFSRELHAVELQLGRLCAYGKIALMLASAALIHLTSSNLAAQIAGYALKAVSVLLSLRIW